LVKLSKEESLELRQNYNRLGKTDLVMQGRYAHSRQFKRAKKARKRLKTQLGCVARDIERKIKSSPELTEKFSELLKMAKRLLEQTRHSKKKLNAYTSLMLSASPRARLTKNMSLATKFHSLPA